MKFTEEELRKLWLMLASVEMGGPLPGADSGRFTRRQNQYEHSLIDEYRTPTVHDRQLLQALQVQMKALQQGLGRDQTYDSTGYDGFNVGGVTAGTMEFEDAEDVL